MECVTIAKRVHLSSHCFVFFLPAAKPSGPRTVRVVVVVGGVVGGSSLLTIGLKKILVSVVQLSSQLKFSSGWDPSRLIEICHSLTRFLFGVGSVTPTDFSSGWDLSHLYCTYLYNGICQGEISEYICGRLLIGSFLSQYVDTLSVPQVFEQSLFFLF